MRLVIGGFLAIVSVSSAFAMEVTPQLLNNFERSCSESGYRSLGVDPAAVNIPANVRGLVTRYCGCTRQEVKATFTLEEFVALDQGRATPQINERLQRIMQACVAKAQQG